MEQLVKQLTHELVINHDSINNAFAHDGGAKQIDKLLGGQLEMVMDIFTSGLWLCVA